MVENKIIDLCKELGQNFIDFSYEANSARAFADARDGLKPGQRACLWEMYIHGYLSNKPHVKSAKIAGAVTGNWWPHGDVAIYETFARMSQPWINNIPEIDWHGNNGSQYTGPECASSRYTEARLSKIAEEGLFQGIKKNNVKMIPNFSEDAEWPEVLPALLPRLMINGCQGIGSTIANVWLPHNAQEVVDVILKYMQTGILDYSHLAPSFPTGGTIINKSEIHTIYETGKGKVILRGTATIKDNLILITELPYQIYAQPYVEKITEMAVQNELTGIEAIYNKSGKNKLLIEIECTNNPEFVLNELYLKTDLQKNYNANQWALVGKTPKLLTLKEYCDIYLQHNISCLVKETQYDLNKAENRLTIILGLLIALEDIDNIIQLIKNSDNAAAAKEQLISKYNLQENQAKAILDMKLSRLAKLEKVDLIKEKEELINSIENLKEILNSKDRQKNVIQDRLQTLMNRFPKDRLTKIQDIEIKNIEKAIAKVEPKSCVVVINTKGEIKRIPTSSFKIQKRRGKGAKNGNDALSNIILTNTIDNLLLFTNQGKMYKILVDNIPEGTNCSKGVLINSLIKLDEKEKVIAVTSLDQREHKKYVIFITANGLFKKTLLDEYLNIKKSTGIAAIKIKDDDTIVNVTFANEEDFLLVTCEGMCIRFNSKDITPIGRATSGVKGIKLATSDKVIGGFPITEKDKYLCVASTDGYAKKMLISDFVIQGRGGKGVNLYKPTLITGILSSALLGQDNDNILFTGTTNNICIPIEEISTLSKTSTGNIVFENGIKSMIKI